MPVCTCATDSERLSLQGKSVSDFPVTDRTGEEGPTSYKDLRVFHSISSVVLQ